MGYSFAFIANKVAELEQQDTSTTEQPEQLQLTDTEQVELEAV